jgi:replicative DNA helicase
MKTLRELPHSPEAECNVLACGFIDGQEAMSACATHGVVAQAFYTPANRVIFEVMQGLFADGKPVEIAVIAEELKRREQFVTIGGYATLAQISASVPTTMQLNYFAETVRDLYQLRRAIEASAALIEQAHNYTGEGVAAHLGQAMERIAEAVQSRVEARTWAQVVAEGKAHMIERLKPESERTKTAWSLPWAWFNLNFEFQPMEPGELVVVAARPSVGKSTLARMQALFAAQKGFPTLLTALEVTDVELAINLVANVTGIRSRRDLDKLCAEEQAKLLGGFDELGAVAKFSVTHTDEWLDEMIGRASAFKARHGLSFWVIDYLQLVADCQAIGKGSTEATAIGKVTRALKRFAVREGCVVMLLSQLNRDSERDDRAPRMSDLRGSGSIEQDANRIIFLDRPGEIPADMSGTGAVVKQEATDKLPWHFIRITQAKGRNHGTGTAGLRLDRATATLMRLARSGT